MLVLRGLTWIYIDSLYMRGRKVESIGEFLCRLRPYVATVARYPNSSLLSLRIAALKIGNGRASGPPRQRRYRGEFYSGQTVYMVVCASPTCKLDAKGLHQLLFIVKKAASSLQQLLSFLKLSLIFEWKAVNGKNTPGSVL